MPQVLFSDDLEAIGRGRTVAGADALQGVPLSAGVAEAPALVLERRRPAAGCPHEPYILVCPSTDPAWVPLFVHAKGLVMETGGVLSHGAIVAREFGLPAVAGLPDVHRRLQDRPAAARRRRDRKGQRRGLTSAGKRRRTSPVEARGGERGIRR